jgi:hypothetical protein
MRRAPLVREMSSMEEERMREFSWRAGTLVAVVLSVIAVFALAPSSAWGASSYNVQECNAGTSTSAPDAQQAGSGGALEYDIHCAVLNGVGWEKGVALHPASYEPGPRSASVWFTAPPTTYFDSGSFRYYIGARYPCSAPNCWYAAIHIGPWQQDMLTTPNTNGSSWSGCGGYCTQIREDEACTQFCLHSTQDPGGNFDDWYYDAIAINRINLTMVDSERPTLALSGSFFDNQIAHGTPNLKIDAADRGSGVEGVTVDVNGIRVGTPATACPGMSASRSYATQFRPCTDFHQAVALDTTQSPWLDGSNTLRVCASDVATGPGVANQVCEQRTISVDNTCQDSQGATAQAQSISAGLEDPKSGRLQRRREVRSSDAAAIRGQLTGPSGPVKAASVCVYETVDEPAGIEQLLQVAKSNSTGRFGAEIPGGPSRTFRVAYRYNDHQIESPSMYLDSSVQPTLQLSAPRLRNGHAVGFRGRVPGPNADGRAVVMQAKVGQRWRSFKQLVTDANGDYRGKYRFTQTHGRVRYTFRALVKKQGGYPYSEGASPKRKVVVRG